MQILLTCDADIHMIQRKHIELHLGNRLIQFISATSTFFTWTACVLGYHSMVATRGKLIDGGDKTTLILFLHGQWALCHIFRRSYAPDGLPELFLSLPIELGILAASSGLKVSAPMSR